MLARYVPKPRRAPIATLLLLASASVMPAPSPLDQPQSWRDDQGGTTTLEPWRHRWVVASLFYTGCHRVCPQTIAVMQQVQQALRAHGVEAELLLVSYNGEAETARSMNAFRRRHDLDSHWHLLAGDADATREFAAGLGLSDYNALDDHVFHDFRVVIINLAGHPSTLDWQHRDAGNMIRALLNGQRPDAR